MSAERVRRTRKTTILPANLPPKARQMIEAARGQAANFSNRMFADMVIHATEQAVLNDNKKFLEFLKQLREPPVSIETFLDSSDFMGSVDLTIWPEVRKAAIDINRYWWRGSIGNAFDECVLTGATGCAKSELAKITTAYHLYLLGCMKNPQAFWGLPSATAIVFSIQAAKPHVTKKVLYLPLRNYIETMPWFVRNMRPNKLLEGEMYFEEQNIRVVQGGSDSDSVLGDAIIHAIIDEINFMNVVENSRKAAPGTGRSGTYDQGQTLYTTVSRRKKSRFTAPGPTIGMVIASSSTRFKGDFTDRRIEFVKSHRIPTTYVYRKAQYEVVPQERFCGKKFRLLVANEAAADIRILEDNEAVPHSASVIEIPIEYLNEFKTDAPGALRDVVGRSVSSINPFFRQQTKIMYCVKKGEEAGLKSFLHKDNVVLGFESLPLPVTGHYCRNPSKPRYVHVDLSISQDRAAVVMLRFDGLEQVSRSDGSMEYLPVASMEVAMSVEPDHGHEIDIAEIRTWVKMLKVVYGYPIKAVTYDGFASIESRQAWAKQGMRTGIVSVDRTSTPYKQLRDALYDGRILLYHQPILIEELFNLEYDEKKDKIDHPVSGGKDIADGLCGAYHTLLTRAITWQGISDNDEMAGRPDGGDRFDDSLGERPV